MESLNSDKFKYRSKIILTCKIFGEMKMEIKTIKLSGKGQISIPKDIRKELHLKNGDKLVLMTQGGQLILQKADLLLKRLNVSEESVANMMISQETLKKDWDNKYDERWNKY